MTCTSITTLCDVLSFNEQHGMCPTYMPSVSFFSATQHEASCPQKYDPGLVFVLQGHKTGYANGQQFNIGEEDFLILTNAYPVSCETFASPQEPLLGLYIYLDITEVQRLVNLMDTDTKMRGDDIETQAVIASKMTEDTQNALNYLIENLHDKVASKALGTACLTRLFYSILNCPEGSALRALANKESKFSRVSSAMRYMEENMEKKILVEELAANVGLSLSAFHRIFKQATNESPLQYLKKLRLTKAKNILVYQKKPTYVTALEVGYESANQFSREFKRYFGVPPSRACELPYSSLIGVGE